MPNKSKQVLKQRVQTSAVQKGTGSKDSGVKEKYKLKKSSSALMLLVVAVAGALIGGYFLLRSRAESDTNVLPPSDVTLCQRFLYDVAANAESKTDYNWRVAINNDKRYCDSMWNSNVGFPDPVGVSPIYRLKDSVSYPITWTTNPKRVKVLSQINDYGYIESANMVTYDQAVEGNDSYVPFYANGGGLPGKSMQCTNLDGVNADFVGSQSRIKFDVKLTNTGKTTWKTSDGYALINPSGNTSFGVDSLPLIDATDPAHTTPMEVGPGKSIVLRATLTLPSANGEYEMFWMMAQNGHPFGEVITCGGMKRYPANAWYASSGTFKVVKATIPKAKIDANPGWGTK